VNRTTRDAVWTFTLKSLYSNSKTKSAAEIAEIAGCSERTARDTLHVMEEAEFVKRKLVDGKVKYQKVPHAFEPDI